MRELTERSKDVVSTSHIAAGMAPTRPLEPHARGSRNVSPPALRSAVLDTARAGGRLG